MAQLNFNNTIIHTDRSWKISPDPSWNNESSPINRFQLFVNDHVDLIKKINNWNTTNFDDSSWKNAFPLLRNSGWPAQKKNEKATHLTTPWTSLIPRDIPYLIEQNIIPSRLVEAKKTAKYATRLLLDATIDKQLLKSFKKGEVLFLKQGSKNESWFLLFDFGEAKSGMAKLNIQGTKNTEVNIYSAPYIINNEFTHKIIDSNFHDQLILSGGNDHWQAMYFKPTRYLAITVTGSVEDVKINSVELHQLKYPFKDQGSISSEDFPWVKQLWEASKKTIRATTTDAYTDNYRERRQYAQTGYYAALGNYFTFGDTALQRRYLVQVAQEQEANGIMPAYAPLAKDDYMIILDSNCLWIRSLHNYLLYSGDYKTVKELLPSANKLMNLLHSYTNDLGLIDNPPYPYWLDHTLNDRRGANLNLNGHYLGALEDYSQILEWLDTSESSTYQERAKLIRNSIQTKFWDTKKQLFADALIDGKLSTHFSEHANAMALATKSATKEQAKLVAETLLSKEKHNFIKRANGMTMVSPAMSYFLLKGLAYYGYEEASLELLHERFKKMLDKNTNQTLWEEWWLDGSGRTGKFMGGRTRSDAQTESVFPPALFTEFLLGINPTKPGLKEFTLVKPSVNSKNIKATLPTPNGLLKINWSLKNQCILKLTIPKSTLINLNTKSFLVLGKQLFINDKAVKGSTNIAIKSGTYTIEVK